MSTKNTLTKILLASTLTASILSANSTNDVSFESLGLNLGYAYMPYNHSGNTPDEGFKKNFTSVELYTIIDNLFEDNSYKPTINYVFNSNSDFHNHTLLLGVNKYFYNDGYDLYLGGLLGFGQLRWKTDTLFPNSQNDYESTSFTGGVQAGVEIPMSKHWALGLNSKFLLHSYNMGIAETFNTSSSYKHPYTASISIGLKYFFNDSGYRDRVYIEEEYVPKKVVVIPTKPIIKEEIVLVKSDAERKWVQSIPDTYSEPDTDRDGIVDRLDMCSDTPEGFNVDERGCERLYTLNIKFAYKSNPIPEQYDNEIDKLARFLHDNPSYNATVNAYTDSVGSQRYNLGLSAKRATSVKNYLLNSGISSNRIVSYGMGENDPVATNTTAAGREQNRRVEVLLSKGRI